MSDYTEYQNLIQNVKEIEDPEVLLLLVQIIIHAIPRVSRKPLIDLLYEAEIDGKPISQKTIANKLGHKSHATIAKHFPKNK